MEPKPPRFTKAAQVVIIAGAVLIFLGVMNLINKLFGSTWWGAVLSAVHTFFSFAWPIALIGIGIYLVWAGKTGKFKNISVDKSRPLRRSATDKRIAGVCGGIAQYLNIDASIVRIVAVILLIASPWITLLVYIIAAIFMPKN